MSDQEQLNRILDLVGMPMGGASCSIGVGLCVVEFRLVVEN